MSDNVNYSCYNCGVERVSLKCGKCKTSTYCSKECQIEDWKNGYKYL